MAIPSYTLVRSAKRRTIALIVNTDAQLIVRAPVDAALETIEKCIRKRSSWIEEKFALVRSSIEKYPPVSLQAGAIIPYLGEDCILSVADIPDFAVEGKTILIPREKSDQKSLLNWLWLQAERTILGRVQFYAKLIGAQYKDFQVTDAKERWGSCGRSGTLNFSWRLIMCPVGVIDYVVIHELSHLKYKGHTDAFWMRVATIMPNYKEQQEWLQQNRKLMETI